MAPSSSLVRTPDSHSGNTGPNPVGATNDVIRHKHVVYDELMLFSFYSTSSLNFLTFPYVSHTVGSNLGSSKITVIARSAAGATRQSLKHSLDFKLSFKHSIVQILNSPIYKEIEKR